MASKASKQLQPDEITELSKPYNQNSHGLSNLKVVQGSLESVIGNHISSAVDVQTHRVYLIWV